MLRAQKNNLKVYSSKNIQLQPDSNLDSHVALVFVYSNSGEEYITVQGNRGDRNNLSLWDNGDDLVLKTANQYNNTVVIITSPGPVDMSRWINHKNIKGIVLALFPGQESGNAITDVLFGDVNPSAKLPFTIAKNSDYCCGVVYDSPGNVVYEESLLVGYRWFDAKNIVPMFPFGFGLSYTTFLVSRLNIVLQSDGSRWVTVIVRNTGRVAGSEVIQLYIGLPKSTASPVKQLKAFDKVFLKPKESKQVSFTLDSNHLSYWDIRTRSWTVAKGLYKIFVGTSSRDIRQSSYFME